MVKKVVVSGSFDDIKSYHVRFLEEASRLGAVHVLLWSDDTAFVIQGEKTKFPQEERLYILQAIRYVDQVTLVANWSDPHVIPNVDEVGPDVWVVNETSDDIRKRDFCKANDIVYIVLEEEKLLCLPEISNLPLDKSKLSRKKVVVTGCFDWLHSGHIRFFEETSELGDLYVIVGHDENVRLLKGDSHPLFPQEERHYMVQAIRYVNQTLISSGHGWMDAEPEIARIKPDIYTVNEDGDKPEKRDFCAQNGLDYIVLKRLPRNGLTQRQSTELRGF
jgi:cytidyltransferase-like protein